METQQYLTNINAGVCLAEPALGIGYSYLAPLCGWTAVIVW